MKNKKLTIAIIVALAALIFSFVFVLVRGVAARDTGKITVGFDWNFRTMIDDPENIKVESGKAYGELPTVEVENEGCTFVGWNTKRDGEGDFVTEDTIVPEDKDDHTLYAIWQGNTYTVSYELNGGTVNGGTTLSPQEVIFGEMYGAMVIPNDPEKPHTEFLGWYLNPEGTGAPIAYSSEVRTADDHTLYAVYRDIRTTYDFSEEEQLEDFIDLDHAGMEIVNDGNESYLKLTPANFEDGTPAKDLYSIFMLKIPLKAGQVVEISCELVGEVVEGWGFWTWGATSTGDIQFDGHVVTAWDTPDLWNNGSFTSLTSITENCEGLRVQLRYVANADAYWKITSIKIKDAGDVSGTDDSAIKGRKEYDFKTADQINDFGKDKNVDYKIVDDYLKVVGKTGSESILVLRKPLKAGMKVAVDVEYIGNNLAYATDNTITFLTYGANAAGDADGNTYAVIGNAQWDGAWDGTKVRTVSEITKDCEGLRMQFVMNGEKGAYFKISNIKIYEAGKKVETLSGVPGATGGANKPDAPTVNNRMEYDFKTADQINDFGDEKNVTYQIFDNSLNVAGTVGSESILVLKKPLKAGMKVAVDVKYIGDDLVYAPDNAITFLTYGANAAGDADGNTYAVIGNAQWDGAWDGSTVRTVSEITKDCEGLRMQFVMNNEAGAYFKITNIKIYEVGEEVEVLPGEPDEPIIPDEPVEPDVPEVNTRTEYDFTTSDQINDFGKDKNLSYEIVDNYLKVVGTSGSESILVLNRALTAGMKVAVDVEYSGNNLAYAAGNSITFLTYGANEAGDADGNTYVVIGNAAWDGAWDCTKVRTVSEITKDCAGLRMQFVMNSEANAYFKITNIKIYEAGEEVEALPVEPNEPIIPDEPIEPDVPVVNNRTEYDFTTSDQLEDFVELDHGGKEIVTGGTGGYVKFTPTDMNNLYSIFWLKRDLKAGMTVEMDFELVGTIATNHGIWTWGADANGGVLFEGQFVTGWDAPNVWNGGKFTSTTKITADCSGIRIQMRYGDNENAYWKLTAVRIIKPVVYDFTTADQINDFGKEKNISYEIVDNCLRVRKKEDGSEYILVLQSEITAGKVVEIDIEYVANNLTFVNGSNQFTFLAYTANAAGDADGKTTAVIGNAPWDGGWNSQKTTVSAAVTQDCSGIRMQFVFNGEVDAYFKISGIRVIDAQ